MRPMEVFTVVERSEGKKSFWVRIGSAFKNKDGSLTVLLDALPTNGKLQIREPREFADDSPGRPRGRSTHEAAKSNGYQRDEDDAPF